MLEQSFMPYLVAFGWVSALLLVGTFLRAKVGFFQKFLVPSSLIGGLIGFILMSLGWVGIPSVEKSWLAIDPKVFSLIAFHLFSFSFIAIGLISGGGSAGASKKQIFWGSLWQWGMFIMLLCLQSMIGYFIFVGYNGISGADFYAPLGMLTGHGFAQGPGQALAISGVWQNTFKVEDALTIGLALAAVGFFVAAFVGVPLANRGIRKGLAAYSSGDIPPEFRIGLMHSDSNQPIGRHTTHPGNIDTVAFHLAIMGMTYLLGYYFTYILKYFILPKALGAITFGFIFFWGMIVAILVRLVLNKTGVGKYIDDNQVRRLTGTCVDFLVVAVLMAIQIGIVWKYIVPLAATMVLAALVTVLLVVFFGKKLAKFGFERIVLLTGQCTGTTPSGLMLLRILDPEFKTPVAVEAGLMNMFGLVLGIHLMFFITLVPGPKFPNVFQMVLVYVITCAVHLGLLLLAGSMLNKVAGADKA
jgi:ESS family glutamate:Na+ symporter